MDLYFLLPILVTIASAAVFTVGLLVYLYAYRRHINKAVTENGQKHRRMIAPRTLAACIPVLSILVGLCAACLNLAWDTRLTTSAEVLDHATTGHEDYNARISMSEEVAAVLCYPDDRSDARFSIYLNGNRSHPNYIFRLGGSDTSIARCASVLEYHGSLILLSLNAPRIAKIRCDNGATYQVDPNSPVVLVIPEAGSVFHGGYTGIEVYGEDGNILNLQELEWFTARHIT